MSDGEASRFYCDESGSTGIDMWSDQQPFYVTGGVLMTPPVELAVNEMVKQLLVRNQWSELKGRQLAKQPDLLMSVLTQAQTLGAEFFFVVAEKGFSICQKIVDVLMDPEHNDAAGWLALSDDVTREQVAEHLYRLPAKTLKGFAKAYQKPSLETWASATESLALQSQLMGWVRIAETLAGAGRCMATIVHWEDCGRLQLPGLGGNRHYQLASIQVPYFLHVVRLVDGVLEGRSASGDVVHDEMPRFSPVYDWYFRRLRGPSHGTTWTSGIARREGITNLNNLTFEESTQHSGLQVADVLCAGVRLAFSSTDRSSTQRTLVPLVAPLFESDLRFARISASARTKQRLTEAFLWRGA